MPLSSEKSFFAKYHFVQSVVDPCVYFLREKDNSIIVLVWVDDLILAGSSNVIMSKIKSTLMSAFRMKDLGPISFFLGMRIIQYPNKIEIDQSQYLEKVP